jgi:hypothetical protein
MPKSNFDGAIKISKLLKNEDSHESDHFKSHTRERKYTSQTSRIIEYQSNFSIFML